MAEYDLVIRGGTIVDGTGIPRYKADLAVKDGRVARISGKINPAGAKEIDASGCIVAPGAVDLHTHYDAQLNWDPYCSLSGWFGVTSLTIGQCGFGFAPTRPEERDLNMRMMNRIEAIPLESMRRGIRWDWESFPEFMDSLDRQGLGLNIGPLFPFSPLRGYVLGMLEARERRSVTESELNQMRQLFYEGMKAGAFGISSNVNPIDRPEDGGFLPSHVASKEEYFALAEVLREFGVGHVGWALGEAYGDPIYEHKLQRELMEGMLRISGRPLHVAGLEPQDEEWRSALHAEGLPLFTQTGSMRFDNVFQLSEFNLFDDYHSWREPFLGTAEERAAKLSNPATRAAMKAEVEARPDAKFDWTRMRPVVVVHERNYKYEGHTIAEIAEMVGKEPLDAWLDLAIDEGLETEFTAAFIDRPDDLLEPGMKDPYSHISVSDGGAHTRYHTISLWPVHFLSYWVRDKESMSLEEGHYKISALPAWFADFKDRGTLRVGAWADVIVYNQEELGYVHDKPIFDTDFPGGERRLIQKPTGLRYTIVNGTVTFEGNDCTGALPGKLLRSYDMVS